MRPDGFVNHLRDSYVYPNAWVSTSKLSSKVLVVTTIGDPTTTLIVEKGKGCIFRSQDLDRRYLVAEMCSGMIGTPL